MLLIPWTFCLLSVKYILHYYIILVVIYLDQASMQETIFFVLNENWNEGSKEKSLFCISLWQWDQIQVQL